MPPKVQRTAILVMRRRLKTWFKSRFDHRIDVPKSRRRSLFYAKWADVGFLRVRWTNEGEVAPGLIRSNNPTEARYRDYAQRGIKTVLNLRHDVDRAPAKLSREACDNFGMTYVSFPMAPRRVPTRQELIGLIELFSILERPILMHCKSGADRTGLASAIWILTQEGGSLDRAREELSLRYLHRRKSETGALDTVLDQFETTAGGKNFEQWVRDDYDPVAAKIQTAAAMDAQGGVHIFKGLGRDLYKYAQYREARWHKSFEKPITTEADRERADFFVNWVDHGVLRSFWTNRVEIAPDVIRSNHPTEERFRKEAAKGIRTILNLRGASDQPQYLREKDLCETLGLDLIDLPMSATKPPQREALLKLIKVFREAERPLLMHCKSGADRTGLAAAIFVLDNGQGMAAARAQLSARYLHFRREPKAVLDRFLDLYEAAQSQTDVSIEDWIRESYRPEDLNLAQ